MEKREKLGIITIVFAALTLMGGVFVWVYSEMKPLAGLEAVEPQRQQWLKIWMEERRLRLRDLQSRVERLEQLHQNHIHDH